jgi:HTH-type transcriptional regulator/antitoxin MqsA
MNHCVICGSDRLVEFERERRLTVNGVDVVVPNDRATACEACGEKFYTGAQSREADRKLVNARRSLEGLLAGEQIRQIRQALGLSQANFEKALGIGPKTVVRWENSTAVQSRIVDNMLRLVAFDPDNIRLLARLRNAVVGVAVSAIPEEKVKEGQLQAAIFAGVEKANVDVDRVSELTDAILSEIHSYKEQRIEQFAEKAQYA